MGIHKPGISVREARLRAQTPPGGKPEPSKRAPESKRKPARQPPKAVEYAPTCAAAFSTEEDLRPRVQTFVSALLPEPGISASYDLLRRHYAPSKALQMVLRRAFDDYEARLDDGSFARLPLTYLPDKRAGQAGAVYTSRMLAMEQLDAARRHFDPLGFESSRAFGRKLATAALAAFFAAEAGPKGSRDDGETE